MSKRDIIYCRLSRQKEHDASFEYQEEQCRHWSAEHDGTVVSVVRETHSGSELDERAELWRVRQLIREHAFDRLLVWKLDRLARNQMHQAVVLYEAQRYGVQVVSTTEDIEDSPVGWFIRQTYGFAAELERQNIRQRSREGSIKRIERGELPGRRAPYGYRYADERKTRLEVDPVTSHIIIRIFTDIANGVPLGTVRYTLFHEGIPTPSGKAKPWGFTIMHHILNNPGYWGEPQVHRVATIKTKSVEEDTGAVHTTETKQVHNQGIPVSTDIYPPIITKELAEAAHARLPFIHRASMGKGYIPAEAYLLRGGFVECGHCGSLVSTRPGPTNRKNIYGRYCCNSMTDPRRYSCEGNYPHISARLLDPKVWAIVNQELQTSSRLVDAIVAVIDNLPANNLGDIESQLADVKAQQQRCVSNIILIDDETSAAPLRAQLKLLGQQAADLETMYEFALSREQRRQNMLTTLNKLKDWCFTQTGCEELSYEEKRQVLAILGVRVKLYGRHHIPRFEVLFKPFGEKEEFVEP